MVSVLTLICSLIELLKRHFYQLFLLVSTVLVNIVCIIHIIRITLMCILYVSLTLTLFFIHVFYYI